MPRQIDRDVLTILRNASGDQSAKDEDMRALVLSMRKERYTKTKKRHRKRPVRSFLFEVFAPKPTLPSVWTVMNARMRVTKTHRIRRRKKKRLLVE